MTNKSDFAPSEWWLLRETPLRVGGAVMVAADSGVSGSLQEIVANATSNADALEMFPNNELLQSIVDPDEKGDYKPEPPTSAGADRLSRQEQLKSDALAKCRQVADLLKRKATPQEADEYFKWLLSIGEHVAMAAKEGEVMGVGSKTVSPEEVEVLQEIAQALGTSHYTPPEIK